MIDTAEVFLLDRPQITHYWSAIEGALEDSRPLWDKWFTKESIFARILDGTMQVWVVCEEDGPIRAVFLTQVLVPDTGRVLQVFWISGQLPNGALKCISSALDDFAVSLGCRRIAVLGRRGWERALRGFGAEFESITLSRPVVERRSH